MVCVLTCFSKLTNRLPSILTMILDLTIYKSQMKENYKWIEQWVKSLQKSYNFFLTTKFQFVIGISSSLDTSLRRVCIRYGVCNCGSNILGERLLRDSHVFWQPVLASCYKPSCLVNAEAKKNLDKKNLFIDYEDYLNGIKQNSTKKYLKH